MAVNGKNNSITKRAFLAKFGKKIDTFPNREASAEFFGFSKEYLYSVRMGNRPPNKKIQEIMGYRLKRVTQTIDSYIKVSHET